ncbi:MAG: DNRLRE domain-containing protein [Candidatus Brocadiae bacterium]|nr:DNRLRE domain-containing protein [Candidatus Brocadiia bacterium]
MDTKIILALFLFMTLLAHPALAVTITPEADSFVCAYSTEVNTNYGTSNLLVKYAAPTTLSQSATRKIYIRFNLSSLNLFQITQATLNLTQVSAGGDAVSGTQTFHVYGLNDLAAGENWGESSITWNNAPGNNTASGYTMNAQTTLLGTFTINGTGTMGSTVSFSNANLMNFLNNDTNDVVTLMITRETYDTNYSGYIHAFASRETGSTSPQLVLNTAPVPEINSVFYLLLALALTGIKKLAVKSYGEVI